MFHPCPALLCGAPFLRQPMGKKKHIDLTELKKIPIVGLAEKLGLQLIKVGPGVWNEKDPEKPGSVTSLTLFERTNTWKRFSGKEKGGVSKGSTIDLVIHVRECDFKTAISFLSSL